MTIGRQLFFYFMASSDNSYCKKKQTKKTKKQNNNYMVSSIPIQKQIICNIVWFQVFLSNANNYMVSSNYFYLVIVICLQLSGFK